MNKSASRTAAAAAGGKKTRTTAAESFSELPLAERRKRIGAFCDEVAAQWAGKPKTGAVKFLLKLRRSA